VPRQRFAIGLTSEDTSGQRASMPITLLDLILLVVMLISGLLAMIRGFIREILSIAAWALAAVAAIYAYTKLLPMAKASFGSELVAAAVVVGGAFLLTLLIVSIITVRVSDMILDSRVGALDRTLGFAFGLARGLLIVVVAFMFFDWLVPKGQPTWIADAKSKVVLQASGEWLKSMLPDDPESTILKRFKRPRGDDPEPQEPSREQRSDDRRAEPEGYGRQERAGMDRLIQGNTKTR
jgi:membrane protein required for colicin V production